MRRANRIIALALGMIVTLAAFSATVSGWRPTRAFDPSGPEKAVQSFVDAAVHGRAEEAARDLAPDSDCEVDDLIALPAQAAPARVILLDSSGTANAATVEIELVYRSAGLFPQDPAPERHMYRLIRSEGSWLLIGVPWPLVECWHPQETV